MIGEHGAPTFGFGNYRFSVKDSAIREPSKDAAAWKGWGIALKPAHEPIVIARKPLVGSVAENVLGFVTGALNIDACRVEAERPTGGGGGAAGGGTWNGGNCGLSKRGAARPTEGRWPANVVTDGSDEVLEAFAAFGESTSSDRPRNNGDFKSVAKGRDKAHVTHGHANTGTAARFFYGSKAGARDRVIHCTACGARAWATDRDAHRHGRRLRAPPVSPDGQEPGADGLPMQVGLSARRHVARTVRGQRQHRAGRAHRRVRRPADRTRSRHVAGIEFRLGLSRPIAGD